MGRAVTMTDRTYPEGVPCWVDVAAPDLDAARAFYGGLFGWEFADAAPDGSYVIATLDGQDVAALAAGGRPQWTTYVAVEDADATAARVEELGGSVVEKPEDAGPGGRAAGCTDPQGAPFRLWQARRRLGAQLVNAPGSWNFSVLRTPDLAGSQAFYFDLFGWQTGSTDGSPGLETLWRRPGYGDHLAATADPEIHERQASAPGGFADAIAWAEPGEPVGWRVTVTVADRDASVETAQRLGATVVDSDDGEWTRTAVVRDPHGAELTLSQFTPPSDWD